MIRHDQGFGAAGLIVLAVIMTVLVAIGVPLVVTRTTVELKDWLSFVGGILGAIGTLIAAYIAWRAVQRQMDTQREAMLLDVTKREEDRLEREFLATVAILEMCFGIADARRLCMGPEEHRSTLQRFVGLTSSKTATRDLIRTRAGHSIPPALLERFSDLFHQLMLAVEHYEFLYTPGMVGTDWAPPEEMEESRLAILDIEKQIAVAASDIEARKTVIVQTLLPECRRRIERGFGYSEP